MEYRLMNQDKWKTAMEDPGAHCKPVPQELLDRVLSAQAYWSQQAKLHGKAPVPPEICLA